MARARNIKPSFFSNEDLVELPFEARLLFIGLWTLADRDGRLEDRPKRIKMAIFPADDVDVDDALNSLQSSGFITRYEARGIRCIQVVNFSKHQNPHHREGPSELPENGQPEASPSQAQCQPEASPGPAVLIPDSLIPDSLIPPSKETLPAASPSGPVEIDALPAEPEAAPATAVAVLLPAATAKPGNGKRSSLSPDLHDACTKTWAAYSAAYAERYRVDPIRNAKVSSQVVAFVKRIGNVEAPLVAAFFLSHNDAFYVRKRHPVDLLLSNAETLRTDWATQSQVTATRSRQVDQTQANYSAADEAMSILRQRRAINAQ